MMATLHYSQDLSESLNYGCNPEKEGDIVLQRGYFGNLSPDENAARWEEMSNDYTNIAAHYIVSFSNEDTAKLRRLAEPERKKMERKILNEFINDVVAKGNNITDCPFVAFHHDNTDNEHIHLFVLMTTWEGKRLRTDFDKKNASRAAARISIKWNLTGPVRSVMPEWYHMLKTGAITEDQMPDQVRKEIERREKAKEVNKEQGRKKRHHTLSDDVNVINDRMRRQQSAKDAEKRKKKYAFLVTEAAKGSKDRKTFLEKLSKEDVEFFINQKGQFSIRFIENDKEFSYSFKQLKLDESIVPYMAAPKEDEKATPKVVNRHDRASTIKSVPQNGRSRGKASRPSLPSGGGAGDENREWEVGDHEGYEESIKNESRLTM